MFDSQWGHHVRYTIWHETYPLVFGADIVAYSTTRYMNGHSDSVGGSLVLRDVAAYGTASG